MHKALSSLVVFLLARMAAVSASALRHVVVIGGGIHGASVAFHLSKIGGFSVTLVEREAIGAAASGKSGGFLAREWGSAVTQELHQKSFDLHIQLAAELGISSFRELEVLQVDGNRIGKAAPLVSWLDRKCATETLDGAAAQVTPMELTQRLVEASSCTVVKALVKSIVKNEEGNRVTGVRLDNGQVIEATDVCVCLGPWSGVFVQDNFSVNLPMQGVKSTSMVFENKEVVKTEFKALFCAEDAQGCHLEFYPRPSGDLYACGLGGSDYVEGDRLREGGDCFDPRDIHADPARVEAALKSFRAMSSLGDAPPTLTQACMRMTARSTAN